MAFGVAEPATAALAPTIVVIVAHETAPLVAVPTAAVSAAAVVVVVAHEASTIVAIAVVAVSCHVVLHCRELDGYGACGSLFCSAPLQLLLPLTQSAREFVVDDPVRLCLGEYSLAGLLFLADVMLDLLGEHRDLGIPIGIVGVTLQEVRDQHLGAVVLDLCLLHEVFFVDRLAAGGIEDFFFQLGVDDQFAADLANEVALAIFIAARFILLEEFLDLAMIELQGFDRRSGRQGHRGRWEVRARRLLSCGRRGALRRVRLAVGPRGSTGWLLRSPLARRLRHLVPFLVGAAQMDQRRMCCGGKCFPSEGCTRSPQFLASRVTTAVCRRSLGERHIPDARCWGTMDQSRSLN